MTARNDASQQSKRAWACEHEVVPVPAFDAGMAVDTEAAPCSAPVSLPAHAASALFFDLAAQPMWIIDARSQRVVAVNPAALACYGYDKQAFLGHCLPTRLQMHDVAAFKRAVALPDQARRVWQHRKQDGDQVSAELTFDTIDFNAERACLVQALDVTARERAEQERARARRAQHLVSACNGALIRAEDEATLLREVCRIAVELGGYHGAWVGFAMHDEDKSLLAVAQCGIAPGLMKKIRMSWDTTCQDGLGPSARAVQSGEAVIVGDLAQIGDVPAWRGLAEEAGYRSLVCLPLRDRDRTFGVLSLYATHVTDAQTEEIDLIQSLADDLAFGITNLRSEAERCRLQIAALKVAAGVGAAHGAEFFSHMAHHMVDAVGADAAFVAELLPDAALTARTLVAVVDGALRDNFDYALAGTPCANLIDDAGCIVPDHVATLFPELPALAAMGARSYIGRRINNAAGTAVGLLFVLYRSPLENTDFVTSVLKIFAARCAGEFERKIADARIREQASLLDKAQDAIIAYGMDSIIRFWNKGAERLYGWTTAEAVGQSVQGLVDHEPVAFKAATASVVRDGEWAGELVQWCKDGTSLTVEGHWTLVVGAAGAPESILAIQTDISLRKAAQKEIAYLAFYDPLTRLPNRQLLMDRLRLAVARGRQQCTEGALLYIDLDNFKVLNDTLGHDTGDLLLQQVGSRLRACIRDTDTVARLGGDEFVIILENLSGGAADASTQAIATGEMVLAQLNRPFNLCGEDYFSTPSIGITLFEDLDADGRELLKRADLAMYQAKAAGRNTIRSFDPHMQAAISIKATLQADMRQSLRDGDFVLFYQPQVRTGHGITGAEALVRWRHPQRGLVSPADFIPLAEETGLIIPLGQWVLETACAQLVRWASNPATAALTLAVNVSARQFRHPHFVAQVRAALAQSGADPHRLKLELTESVMVDNVDDTCAKMATLKTHGLSFALDDFGTGYSSLSYLKRLPLNLLKIDQSFVRDILVDPNDAIIARTIVTLAHSLGLDVIAEGVETAPQRDALARFGCHAYQGYIFSRPLPIDEFDGLLARDAVDATGGSQSNLAE